MATSKTAPDAGTLKFLTITKGVVTILFGIMALVWPGLTALTLTTLITLWLLVSGVINVVRSIMSIGSGSGWVFSMLLALLQIGVGAYLVQRPGLTIATFIALIAIVFIVEGIVGIVSPLIDGKSTTAGEKTLSVIFGILSVVAGIAVWRYPVSGGLAFVWIIGLYALITGPMWIAIGLDVHKNN